MLLTESGTNKHRNVYIPARQKHVGKEIATEITQQFTEMVTYIILTRRKNRIGHI